MTKNCPNCGKQVPDDAKFCMDCGHSFEAENAASPLTGILGNGKIFLVIIAIVVILGLIVIGMTGNNDNADDAPDDVDHVKLTIADVNGYDSSGSKKSYTLYTQALFHNVPDKLDEYLIKTTYYDKKDNQIGQETEKLDQVYYDSNYALSFGYYTAYKLPNPDYVNVEIIKDGEVIDNYTQKIDTNKIDFLN